MKSLRLMAAVGALIALCAIPYAFAAGLFPGLPIVGQAAYCAGYSLYPTTVTTPGTLPTPNQCNTTAPAGPAALTGVELQPADTTVANGPPATVLVPMALGASGAYYDNTGVTNTGNNLGSYLTSTTIPNNINTFVMDTTTTIAALSLTFPSSPLNSQLLRVASQKTITAFTPVANTTVNSAITITGTLPSALTPSATAAVGYAWIYNSGNTAWERLQ